ncbi:MAG: chromosome segregation protein SMC [Chitinophagales bacterium]|nr:chromosome segregation protein SMC [Chitinophagales bacterium]
MRLISLEIKGFKSFPEKTTINFNDSITGVVGPNGCGKSNVVDAIRWVLGEQKTTMLRSEKMENVIFNGTKVRKPSSLAEVSLTFENDRNLLPTEYHTLTISRHYYRNGDSEYKLNNITCRLKDITSLFLDTGISSDSYAIIELQMIDEILNDKDNSRRKLFEQAAGISKYKARKKETLNKLEATQLDLNRVDDLLFEIENNLKALEGQAKKTERYYKLKEEYRNLSIELALFTLDDFKKSFDSLKSSQQQEEEKKIAQETQIILLEATLQKEKSENILKEKRMIAAQREQNEFVTAIRQKENEKNILSENLKFKEDKKQSIIVQNQKASEELNIIADAIDTLHADSKNENALLAMSVTARDLSKISLDGLRADYTSTKLRLDDQAKLFHETEKEFSEIERESSINEVKKLNLLQEKERARIDHTNRKMEQEQLHSLHNTYKNEEQHKKDLLLELTDATDQLQQEVNRNEESVEEVRDQLRGIHRDLDARQNEYNLTKSFIDNMEGFPESIKYLKQQSDWTSNAKLLSDIVSCPSEYRIAVENFLEPWLNFYVVADMQEALHAVNLLSDAAKGRASFFVLNDFEKDIKPDIDSGIFNAIKAIDVVEADSKYEHLVAYLLSGVFLLGDENEVDFSAFPKEARLISKNGKYIRTLHGISGGQVGAFSGKRLGRIKNLKSLESEINELKDKENLLQQSAQNLQLELARLKNSSRSSELNNVREEHNQVKNKVTGIIAKLENLDGFFAHHRVRMEAIEESLLKLEEEQTQLKVQHSILSDKKSGQQELLIRLSSELASVESGLSLASEQFNQKNILYLQQQNKISHMQRELEYKNQQFQATQQLIEKNKIELQEIDEGIIILQEKLRLVETEIIHDYGVKDAMAKAITDAEQTYYESRGKINEAEEQIRMHTKNKEQVDHLLNEIHDKVTELKIQLNSLKDRLQIEFKVDIESLMEREPDIELNAEELKQKAERYRNRIDTYGEINPMAMEAFNEMKQRHDFIVSQKTDLMNAKTSLMETIGEIENTAKTQFLSAFSSIKENFIRTFKSLFTEEDECDLILENQDNILESKIQIIAKPKGKRPQIIDQLSGGEKTLTAISLLFALYLYKPAPFCILDEVDAPLDDANITKFNKIIRDFSERSQFVLVTHNKQTMAAVDVIYGITMQEEGVSKVVPVDFRSLN